MGWKFPSKHGMGKVLECRLWIAGGEDAVEEHHTSLKIIPERDK